MAKSLRGDLNTAAQQYKSGQKAAAAKATREIIEKLVTFRTQNPDVWLEDSNPTLVLLRRLHARLQVEGEILPPLRLVPRVASTTPTERSLTNESALTKSETSSTGVSFVRTVAPILDRHCGGCHVRSGKGGFRMRNFAELMRGPSEGVVVFAGDPIGSRLIETIETGDMPRGGGRVPADELQTLKDWVSQGAKFDGDDPATALPILAAAKPPAATPRPPLDPKSTPKPAPKPTTASSGSLVSFSSQVAPILAENCNGCHLETGNVRGGLNMNTFAALVRGGDSGEAFTAGNGDASLLVRKLRGMEGARMPGGGRPAIPEDQIQLISNWIDQGAKFDGDDTAGNLTTIAKMAWVNQASPAEVSARRKAMSESHLMLTLGAGTRFESLQTEHFLLLGATSPATLQAVAEVAESFVPQAKKLVPGESGEGYFNGRATIFVWEKRYDYSEFAKMVEQRSVPRTWTQHWRNTGLESYLSLVVSPRDDASVIGNRLRSPLYSLAVSTRGEVPRWLAEGVGTAASFRSLKDKTRRREIETGTRAAWAAMPSAKAFFDGKMSPEESDFVGAAIASALVAPKSRRQFDKMFRDIRAGNAFEDAFINAYSLSPEDFVTRLRGQ
ncbi:MAG: c-type cytochrome domain-containing protein [Planctomycetota bacterium]